MDPARRDDMDVTKKRLYCWSCNFEIELLKSRMPRMFCSIRDIRHIASFVIGNDLKVN